MGDVVDRGAKYPWNTDGKYVVDTLMRITDHFLIGTHEAAFFLRAMDEIREDGEVSELLYEMYFNSDNLHGGWSNGGYKTASELLEVSKFPSGLEASKGMYFMSIRERLSVALRDPDNYFARFGDWMREHGKLSIILETSDGKKVMAVH